jgi:hypothetical protein
VEQQDRRQERRADVGQRLAHDARGEPGPGGGAGQQRGGQAVVHQRQAGGEGLG